MSNRTDVLISYSAADEDTALVVTDGMRLASVSNVGNGLLEIIAGNVKSLDEGAFLLRVANAVWENEEVQVFIRPEGETFFTSVRWIDIVNFLDGSFEPTECGTWVVDRYFTASEVTEHAAALRAKFLREQEESRLIALQNSGAFRDLLAGIREEINEPADPIEQWSNYQVTRAEFELMSTERRQSFIRAGGTVHDSGTTPPRSV